MFLLSTVEECIKTKERAKGTEDPLYSVVGVFTDQFKEANKLRSILYKNYDVRNN